MWTVFLTEWPVAAFEVFERENLEENRRPRQKEQQHRLKPYIHIHSSMHIHAYIFLNKYSTYIHIQITLSLHLQRYIYYIQYIHTVRSQQHICVMQRLRQQAGRPRGRVHQHLINITCDT
jgi:hypothetical protein